MNTPFVRAAAVVGVLAIATAVAVSCSQAREIGSDIASSAQSIGSSAASAASSAASAVGSAAGSAASSAASAASSAASSAGNAASSVVSSVLSGAPTTVSAPGVGEVTLDGATAEAYQKAGGEAALGAPTAQPQQIGDGTAVAFANGTVFSSPSTGAHVVRGEILRAYLGAGGPTGPLGFPTGDESTSGAGPAVTGGGLLTQFQNGTITWLNQGNGTFAATVTTK